MRQLDRPSGPIKLVRKASCGIGLEVRKSGGSGREGDAGQNQTTPDKHTYALRDEPWQVDSFSQIIPPRCNAEHSDSPLYNIQTQVSATLETLTLLSISITSPYWADHRSLYVDIFGYILYYTYHLFFNTLYYVILHYLPFIVSNFPCYIINYHLILYNIM